MSVSVRLNRAIVVGGFAVIVLVTGTLTGATPRSITTADDAIAQLRTPSKDLDVVASQSPAASAIATSERFFTRSRVVALVAPDDHQTQMLAIETAANLGIPVLIDRPGASAEIARLRAKTVLTFGGTHSVRGSIPVTETTAAAQISRIRKAHPPAPRHPRDAIVVTQSAQVNAVAIANAVNAGARTVESPTADPRRDPAAAKLLAAHPKSPVIALGTSFQHDFAYSLSIVRGHVTQATGGYLALPGKTYTALYGHPGAPSLGVLGEQGVKASVARAEKLVRKYRRVGHSHFVPTFEIIATVAASGAGKDKNYTNEVSTAKLRPLIDAAGKAGMYVILDLQPGRADFLSQAKRYRSLLLRPYVGLALDPEWRLTKKQKPLRQIGSVQASEINRTSSWLAKLTREHTLPQKIFVLHQFALSMIKHRSKVNTDHAELATVIHVDGQGAQPDKQGTWKTLHHGAPKGVFWGWKNFVDEDKPMLSAKKTWQDVRPRPNLISYQ